MDIRFFDTLDSTNNYCKLLDPNSVGEFTVIWAANQTAGIGQQGNVWVSEPHKNLTFSLILKPSFLALADQWLLSMTLALAVSDCLIEHLPGKNISIKWPNDIYAGSEPHPCNKICGILVTNQISNSHISQAICGIGLNVNQTAFPDWLPNPTSMKLLSNVEYDLSQTLESLISYIETRYTQLKTAPETIKPAYISRLFRYNQPAKYIYEGETITATITDVDSLGHLHLKTNNNNEHIPLNNKELICDLKEIKFLL